MNRVHVLGAAVGRRIQLLALSIVLVAGLLFGLLRFLYATLASPDRAWRIAIGVDQLVNVAANGHEDETISSRADRAREEGRRWGCILCRLLDAIERDHCKKARGT